MKKNCNRNGQQQWDYAGNGKIDGNLCDPHAVFY